MRPEPVVPVPQQSAQVALAPQRVLVDVVPDGFLIVDAGGALGGLTRRPQRRQQQRRQDRDDRDHDEELDQREAAPSGASSLCCRSHIAGVLFGE